MMSMINVIYTEKVVDFQLNVWLVTDFFEFLDGVHFRRQPTITCSEKSCTEFGKEFKPY